MPKLSEVTADPAPTTLKLSDLRNAPPAAPQEKPESVAGAFMNVPKDIGHRIAEAGRAEGETLKHPLTPTGPRNKGVLGKVEGAIDTAMKPIDAVDSLASGTLQNTLNLVSSPVTGLLDATVGRPVEKLTHGKVKRETAGDIASMLTPLGEEMAGRAAMSPLTKALGVDAKQARGVLDSADRAKKAGEVKDLRPHHEAVKQLRGEGVELTPGMQRGGIVRRFEEAAKSNPKFGQGLREEENHSLRSYNRAHYNRALKEIGEEATKEKLPDNKIGNDGVAYVEGRLDAIYNRAKPGIKFQRDDEFVREMGVLQKEASELPKVQKDHFGNLIVNRVLPALKSGTLNGEQFKTLDSVLGKHARLLGSGDAYSQEEGDVIERLQALMRENTERHSDPKVIADLSAANRGWAQYVRIRRAAANRSTSNGVFTPNDMLTAAKIEDKSVGNGSFAKGKAIAQDLAKAAHRVISPHLQDSGTTERMMMNGRTRGPSLGELGGVVAGWPGLVVGRGLDFAAPLVTNPIAAKLSRQIGKIEPKFAQPNIPPPKVAKPKLTDAAALAALAHQADGQSENQ